MRCTQLSCAQAHVAPAVPAQQPVPCRCQQVQRPLRRVQCNALKQLAAKPSSCCGIGEDPLHPISGSRLEPCQCWTPTAVIVLSGLLASAFILKTREKKPATREVPDPDLAGSPGPVDPRHHQRVLAKAKQATHISSAISYNRAGEFTKANLELGKALAANSVCRAPAVLANSKDDLADLYRLHIRFTEQPPSFGTLLQLQEMLGLRQEEAEQIELELMGSANAFAI